MKSHEKELNQAMKPPSPRLLFCAVSKRASTYLAEWEGRERAWRSFVSRSGASRAARVERTKPPTPINKLSLDADMQTFVPEWAVANEGRMQGA
ncbi:hypothetical protein TNIN_295071 [Trichonephila inaurata madagascariensis]|uniref:Uncharacterized protein n=1 Tax=Trichonephila inaurata madagascariensis TaxID=2747483 RepID=A0A8X6JE46_9ARAC|nr:hypothetical protein TNIN_295071 [Trichonephila inaurata madagascariensis]